MTLQALHVLNRAQACLIQSFFLRFCKSKSSHNFLNFIAPLVIRDFSLCQWDNFAWKGHLDYDVTACQLKVIQIKVLFFSSIIIKTLRNCLNGDYVTLACFFNMEKMIDLRLLLWHHHRRMDYYVMIQYLMVKRGWRRLFL